MLGGSNESPQICFCEVAKAFIMGSHNIGFPAELIAPDKTAYLVKLFFYFSMKTYVIGTHWKRLGKALVKKTTV